MKHLDLKTQLLRKSSIRKKFGIPILALLFISLLILPLPSCNPEKQSRENDNTNTPTPKEAKVLVDGLKVRISPSVMGAEMGILKNNVNVQVLEKSASRVRVGKMSAHWYKVENPEGLKGWVYGAYLSIEADPHLADEKARKLEKIKEAIIGRWYLTFQSGSMLDVFVAIYPDQKIAFGSAGKEHQKGEYQVLAQDSKVKLEISGIKKPVMEEFNAEMRNETLLFNAKYRGKEYKLKLSDKNPSLQKTATEKSEQ